MGGVKTSLPQRKRSYRVALAPLADAMFQLLTFFMLTTSLTPYSLITLKSAAESAGELEQVSTPAPSQTAGASNPQPSSRNLAIWELGNGFVTAGGQVFEDAQLPELARAFADQDTAANVVIIVGDGARLQDVASAMSALQGANVADVQLSFDGQ